MSEFTDRSYEITPAWKAYQGYMDFLRGTNAIASIRQRRDFYRGKQYADGVPDDIPKPTDNICFEYVEKTAAKILESDCAIEFTAEDSSKNLRLLDQFYEYQCRQVKDPVTAVGLMRNALVDGVGCVFTMYDDDTYGVKGKYRGYLKRKIVPFEDVFFADPYCEDPQDQKWLGFVQKVSVAYARSLCENEEERKNIVADGEAPASQPDRNEADVPFGTVTLVTRYFRDKDGEVCFELATKYANLYKTPRHLRPDLNALKDSRGEDGDWKDMGEEKAGLQTKPVKESETEYRDRLKVFWRYPFAWLRPYPVQGTVLGESALTQIIPNQKQINFTNQMSMLNLQSHGMSKYVIREGALQPGEELDNDPAVPIRLRTNPGESVGNAIQRMEPSQMSAEQLGQASAIAQMTRQTYGFANLTADNDASDTSGYALSMVQKSMFLMLQPTQKAYWDYRTETAKTDLLFFRDFVDEADFYVTRSQGSLDEAESYREMAQSIFDAQGKVPQGADEHGQLPEVPEKSSRHVTSEDFMKDFEVSAEAVQGIENSQILESQHYSQVMQWVLTGNADTDTVMAFVDADPAYSRKTRDNLRSAIQAVRNGQIAQKQAEIDQLKASLTSLSQNYRALSQQVQSQELRLTAYKKATEDNAARNGELVKQLQDKASGVTAQGGISLDDLYGEYGADDVTGSAGLMTEGEAKSASARGIEGTRWQ